jgi:large subunit ribosomal protein L7/L12
MEVRMTSEKIDQVIDLVKEMTALELVDLKKAFEETFDVQAAAPMMMGAVAAPGAAADAGAAEEEKTSFDVILEGFDAAKKIQVIKVVRAVTSLGLKEAKDLVEGAPKPVKEGIPKDEAEKIQKELQESGGTVAIK